ncbi:MAG: peptide-methionine (S)-S-oxide reductase MsrA [Candidatus Latescibacteria bacterium]|jgi:peptide-methionine (S)-S-oxide reductase|nr:peptide-methionine (S)-S-oxide reductase MsrA [Candidatus Latescibacterota bacterium]
MGIDTVCFGGGCFWGVEAEFQQIEGVTSTKAGYCGGDFDKPTYRDICSGQTGHAEVVEVKYDPSVVPIETLLDVFWNIHDPTTKDRQGPDIGNQYRSAIFCADDTQAQAAQKSKETLEKSGKLRSPVVTEIAKATVFHTAEAYHQRYMEKRGLAPNCHAPLLGQQ